MHHQGGRRVTSSANGSLDLVVPGRALTQEAFAWNPNLEGAKVEMRLSFIGEKSSC